MKERKVNIKFRFNILLMIVYFVGVILIAQLFNLQIIQGGEYRNLSNTRLTRETALIASRGNIRFRSGDIAVGSETGFMLEMYKTQIEEQELNKGIYNIITLLEEFETPYTDLFPVNFEAMEFKLKDQSLSEWKEKHGVDDGATVKETIVHFMEKYSIEEESLDAVRKIIAIRYAITVEGYSSTKAIEIAGDIPREVVAKLNEMNELYPGINIVTQSQRYYPQGTIASHILGYVGAISQAQYEANSDIYKRTDLVGKTGIEYTFEEFLKGTDGIKQVDMDIDGSITNEYIYTEAVAGSDVVLTIDSNLQKVTATALENNIKKIASGGFGKVYDTNSGAAVVMDVKTGEILAMASYPDYDLTHFVGGISTSNWNMYTEDEAKPLVNKAVQNSYAPGSIYKMVTATAALESGTITATTKINDTGIYTKYTNLAMKCWVFSDYGRGHGWLDITGAIEKSCNYFFYEVADRMGIDELSKYARYYGLGYKTGVELQGETNGVLASKETKAELHPDDPGWNPGNTLNAAIGQGDNEFSPLQMAQYISMLANGGNPLDVTLVQTIIKADGSEYEEEEIQDFVNNKLGIEMPEQEDVAISSKNLEIILDGMKSVTSDSGGTAYVRFADFDIEVGGKTGSAEAPGGKVHAWFAGFAPFDDPEIAIVVMVDNGGHGNYTAEAVVDIMREYFGMNTEEIKESYTAIPYTNSIR